MKIKQNSRLELTTAGWVAVGIAVVVVLALVAGIVAAITNAVTGDDSDTDAGATPPASEQIDTTGLDPASGLVPLNQVQAQQLGMVAPREPKQKATTSSADAPSGLAWTRMGNAAVPNAPGVGPFELYNGYCTRGYANTAQGAIMFLANSMARTMAPGGVQRCAPDLLIGPSAGAALAEMNASGDKGSEMAAKVRDAYPKGLIDQKDLFRSVTAAKVDSFAPGSAKISLATQDKTQGASFTISTVDVRYTSTGTWQYVVDSGATATNSSNSSSVAALPEGFTLWL